MSRQILTKQGYDFYEVSSALQKSIRRNDIETACFFGLELFHSGYGNYCWKRLYTISAEDCWGIITKEISALHMGYEMINKTVKGDPKGRIFITKAIVLLCQCTKSRDTDHIQNLMYDKMNISEERINGYIERLESDEQEKLKIPDYAYDVHTRVGKMKGKTKTQFFIEEQQGLKPKQVTLFEELIPKR